jgi:acyl carrier protein
MSDQAASVRQIVARQLGIDAVAPADRLVEDLGAESMDLVTIVAVLEETYQIRVDEERLPVLLTVGDLAAEIARLTGGTSGTGGS